MPKLDLPRVLPFLAIVAVSAFVNAVQVKTASAQLTDDKRAVLAFDVYLDRLLQSETIKKTGLEDAAPLPVGEDTVQPDDVRRIFGAVSAPASVQAIEEAQDTSKPLQFEFFIRVQFKDEATCDKQFADIESKSKKVTVGGKEFLKPATAEDAPPNMLAQRLNATTMEMGTEGYLTLSNRNVFSTRLMAAWPKMPVAGIRLALDLDGARPLIDEAIKTIPGGVPMAAQPALALVQSTSVLRLGLDFTGENMLWLTMTGKDEASTSQLNNMLSGLLTMGKSAGQQFLPMAGEEAQGPGTEILNALVTKVDGNDVNIVIPKPEGLEEAAEAIVGQMMMGAMQPAGGDDFGGDLPPADDPFGGGADPFGN